MYELFPVSPDKQHISPLHFDMMLSVSKQHSESKTEPYDRFFPITAVFLYQEPQYPPSSRLSFGFEPGFPASI